jgi:hypothetical protein
MVEWSDTASLRLKSNIIDASVIEAKQSRKRKGRDGNNTQDPETGYNVTLDVEHFILV